jgi:hypothetical protein
MKTIKIEKFGGPEVLEVKDIEIGKPGLDIFIYSKFNHDNNFTKTRKIKLLGAILFVDHFN